MAGSPSATLYVKGVFRERYMYVEKFSDDESPCETLMHGGIAVKIL